MYDEGYVVVLCMQCYQEIDEEDVDYDGRCPLCSEEEEDGDE